MLIDTHAHLSYKQFARDRAEVIQRARDAGVGRIISVGFDLESSRWSLEFARRHPGVNAAVGVHPHDAAAVDEAAWSELERMARDPSAVAVGETGLDYYRDLSPRPAQQGAFRRHIALARAVARPLIVHDRDAHEDVIRILTEEGAREVGVVMHCFSGDWELAHRCLELGFYISLAGPVTFHNSRQSQEVARRVPLDMLLLETDCPYLAPEPFRGKRNEPAFVRIVAERVAELRGIDPETLAEATTANAARLFGLGGV